METEGDLLISNIDNGVTFQFNKNAPIHRWYPYIEGFSGDFVKRKIKQFNIQEDNLILDPFVGCGTTSVEATLRGIDSIGVEINPFMCFVSRTKTHLHLIDLNNDTINNTLENISHRINLLDKQKSLNAKDFDYTEPKIQLSDLFSNKEYFSPVVFKKLLIIKEEIFKIKNEEMQNFLLLALASILVNVSNLQRCPDLKYKKSENGNPPVYKIFREKLLEMYTDIKNINNDKNLRFGKTKIFTKSAQKLDFIDDNSINLVITSPPYLNGTNYIRNTKLELWFLDLIKDKKDLKNLRKEAITASINTTQTRNMEKSKFNNIAELVERLKNDAYDKRIPVMVNSYFIEINNCLNEIHKKLDFGKYCVFVIGDSLFGSVYIPTDALISDICKDIGFNVEKIDIVRKRKSRSGYKLHESVLYMRKEK